VRARDVRQPAAPQGTRRARNARVPRTFVRNAARADLWAAVEEQHLPAVSEQGILRRFPPAKAATPGQPIRSVTGARQSICQCPAAPDVIVTSGTTYELCWYRSVECICGYCLSGCDPACGASRTRYDPFREPADEGEDCSP